MKHSTSVKATRGVKGLQEAVIVHRLPPPAASAEYFQVIPAAERCSVAPGGPRQQNAYKLLSGEQGERHGELINNEHGSCVTPVLLQANRCSPD